MLIFKQNHKRWLTIAILVIIFLGSLYAHKRRVLKRNYADFHCYYTTGQRLLNQEDIYIQDENKEVAEFRYAPIFAVFMSGLALLNENTADTIWYSINFFLLIISFVCLENLVSAHKLDTKSKSILYVLTTLGVIRFILHNFNAGQTNILMLSSILVGLYYIAKGREVLGGSIFAFSIMLKYTPAIFIPYFLLKRKIKLTLTIMVAALAYLVLPALFIGFKTNLIYLKNLVQFLTHSSILDKITILDPQNQSLFSLWHRFFTNCIAYFHAPPMPFQDWHVNDATINLIFILSAMILYFLVLYQPKRRYNTNVDYALLLICAALFNLNAWMHNYIFLWLPYFVLASYLISTHFKDKIMLIFLTVSYLLSLITLKSILGKTWAYKVHFYSPHALSALIVFFLLLKIKFQEK